MSWRTLRETADEIMGLVCLVKSAHRMKLAFAIAVIQLDQRFDMYRILGLRSPLGVEVKVERWRHNQQLPQCRRGMALGHT